jgi:hypothetical protein
MSAEHSEDPSAADTCEPAVAHGDEPNEPDTNPGTGEPRRPGLPVIGEGALLLAGGYVAERVSKRAGWHKGESLGWLAKYLGGTVVIFSGPSALTGEYDDGLTRMVPRWLTEPRNPAAKPAVSNAQKLRELPGRLRSLRQEGAELGHVAAKIVRDEMAKPDKPSRLRAGLKSALQNRKSQ